MVSKRRYTHLIPSVLVATSLILSACQESSHQVTPRVASGNKGGANAESITGRTKLTKEQENQVVDPTSLVSYKDHLKPIFDKLDEGALTSWSALFKLKRWIIAPMDLKKDEATSLSMTYSEANAQATARQTQFEVWIDSRTMKDAADKEKADLILGEFLTSLYTLKNLSPEQLCALVKDVSPKTTCALSKPVEKEVEEKVEPVKAATAARRAGAKPTKNTVTRPPAMPTAPKSTPLVQSDYNNIRIVKNYILQNGKNIRHDELVRKMSESGFDVRIFEVELKQDEGLGDSGKVSGEALESLFVQAKAMDKTKAICHLLQLGTQAACEISVQRTVEQVPDAESRKFLKYSLKEENAEEAFLSESAYQLKEISVGRYPDKETAEELRLVPLTGVALSNRVVGATFHMSYMVVLRTKDSLKLEGFLAIPGVVSKITQDETKNKTLCEGTLAEAKDKSTDMILVAKDSKYAEAIKAAVKGIQAVPPCW